MELSSYLDEQAIVLLEQYVIRSNNESAISIWTMLYNKNMMPYKRNELAKFRAMTPYVRIETVIQALSEIVRVFISDYRRDTGITYKKAFVLGCIAGNTHSYISSHAFINEYANEITKGQLKRGEVGIEKVFNRLKKNVKAMDTPEPIKPKGVGILNFRQLCNEFISKANPYCYLHERYFDFSQDEISEMLRLLDSAKKDIITIENQIKQIREID